MASFAGEPVVTRLAGFAAATFLPILREDARQYQLPSNSSARRFALDADGLPYLPQGPAGPTQSDHLVRLLFTQDVAHIDVRLSPVSINVLGCFSLTGTEIRSAATWIYLFVEHSRQV
jgi:hypothetical protein